MDSWITSLFFVPGLEKANPFGEVTSRYKKRMPVPGIRFMTPQMPRHGGFISFTARYAVRVQPNTLDITWVLRSPARLPIIAEY